MRDAGAGSSEQGEAFDHASTLGGGELRERFFEVRVVEHVFFTGRVARFGELHDHVPAISRRSAAHHEALLLESLQRFVEGRARQRQVLGERFDARSEHEVEVRENVGLAVLERVVMGMTGRVNLRKGALNRAHVSSAHGRGVDGHLRVVKAVSSNTGATSTAKNQLPA